MERYAFNRGGTVELQLHPQWQHCMSSSSSDGSYNLTITFKTGTDPDLAQVKVQNRVSQASPLLPGDVTRQGVAVYRKSSNILGVLAFYSPKGTMTPLEISDYLNNNVQKNVMRVSGVGDAMVFGSSKSMRVWLAVSSS